VNWDRIDEELRLEELDPDRLEIMPAHEAMILLQKNTALLARVNNLLLQAQSELGRWRVIVDKLKQTKNTLIEQNRALKEIIKADRF